VVGTGGRETVGALAAWDQIWFRGSHCGTPGRHIAAVASRCAAGVPSGGWRAGAASL